MPDQSQPDLFSAGEQRVVTKLEAMRQRFILYHSANPGVYHALVRRARKLKRSGTKRFGIQGLMAVVRYLETRRIQTEEPFQINNSMSGFYARLIMDQEPDLAGFFETREMTSARSTVKITTEIL